jgi:hypothetical protein
MRGREQTMKSGVNRLQGVFCMAFAFAVSASAAAQTGRFTPACAERDLKVVSLIEHAGETGNIASDRLGEIGLAHLQARLSCLDGNESEAVAQYNRILSLDAVAFGNE